MLFLSYILSDSTPSYGNRNQFTRIQKSNISKGDVANDSEILTNVHMGTHIDMPYHFYEKGQTIEEYDASFWFFKSVLIVEIEPRNYVIEEELINKLENIEDQSYEILIVKTGACYSRDHDTYMLKNYGFSDKVAQYIRTKFNKVRVMGFDTISVSSFTNRARGRESHKSFLDPSQPILLLEDMDLKEVNENTQFQELIISPLRVSYCDGLPTTVFAKV